MQAATQKNEWLTDDTYVEVVGFVVVHVQCPEQLWVPANCNVFDIADAVNDGLAGELLHLDVVELPEVTEPLDQLGGDAAVELEMERKRPLILCTSLLQSWDRLWWQQMKADIILFFSGWREYVISEFNFRLQLKHKDI